MDYPTLIVNGLFHALILFTFLCAFFFYYIAGKVTESIEGQFTNAIRANVPTLLAGAQQYNLVDWTELKSKAIRIQQQPPSSTAAENNQQLMNRCRWVILGLIALLVVASLYFWDQVDLKVIVAENIFVFALIGILEFYFFTHTGSKYIPIKADEFAGIVLQQTKHEIIEAQK